MGWLPLPQSVWVASVAGFDDPAFYGDRWAEVYDEHHAEFDPAPAVEFLAGLAGDRRALELAIGTGRIALPLAGRGVAVEGIDASAAMVEQLRAKPGGASIPVVIGDMAQVAVTGPFGLVYLVFNTLFGLLSQAQQATCFGNVARVLGPGRGTAHGGRSRWRRRHADYDAWLPLRLPSEDQPPLTSL
jgi:methyltransferase family protein